MRSTENDGVRLDMGSGYDRALHQEEPLYPSTMVLNANGTFSVYGYAHGKRHWLARDVSRDQAERAKADWKPKPPAPVKAKYIDHPFNSRKGYWIVEEPSSEWTPEHGYQRWSVWRCDAKGNVFKHAGKCLTEPTVANAIYLDPAIDAEPAMFGSDWLYFVQRGIENHGDPEIEAAKRDGRSKGRGARHDMDEVRAYIAQRPSVRVIMERFGVSRRTAYRWVEKYAVTSDTVCHVHPYDTGCATTPKNGVNAGLKSANSDDHRPVSEGVEVQS